MRKISAFGTSLTLCTVSGTVKGRLESDVSIFLEDGEPLKPLSLLSALLVFSNLT